ncbi:MAG: hypothetical protein SW833_03725 [Cyanobacteriota bacterium]|nr:hypothetical protein [Cyanobacteriota bacterium]
MSPAKTVIWQGIRILRLCVYFCLPTYLRKIQLSSPSSIQLSQNTMGAIAIAKKLRSRAVFFQLPNVKISYSSNGKVLS